MTFLARLGLAITHPRWALTLAGDRKQAGRSGSDLIAVIGLVLLATQLRGLFAAAWLGRAVSPGLGMRAAMHVLTRSLTFQLGFLVIAASFLFIAAGRKRNLGRAFDLACVALLPVVFVELVATVVVRATEVDVPWLVSINLAIVSYTWAGTLVALAHRVARSTAVAIPDPPATELTRARRAGRGVLAVVLIGAAIQVAFIVNHSETMRPMTDGDAAPSFTLPVIGPKGMLGARVSLDDSRGRVTIVDFWATWCGPCLRAMPGLDALAAQHPDVTILAVNLDDPAEARALFDERHYRMTLVADDGQVSERFGVTTIPHSVVIDRQGVVRLVHRGGGTNVELEVSKLLAEQIRN